MNRRFHNKHLAIRSKKLSDGTEEAKCVWQFVNYVECEHEVQSSRKPDSVNLTLMQFNPLLKRRTSNFGSYLLKHTFLQVSGNDMTCRTNKLCNF